MFTASSWTSETGVFALMVGKDIKLPVHCPCPGLGQTIGSVFTIALGPSEQMSTEWKCKKCLSVIVKIVLTLNTP